MKKLALVAAIAAAMPVLAHADVTIGGDLRIGLNHTTPTSGVAYTGMDDYASRIWFQGTEDLGNGTSVIWHVKSAMSIDGDSQATTGAGPLASSTAYLGMKGAFGNLRAGKLDDTIKESEMTDQVWGSDMEVTKAGNGPRFNNTINQYEVMGYKYGLTDVKQKHSVTYNTPTWNNITGTLHYAFGEARDTQGQQAGNSFSGRIAYDNKAAGIFASYAVKRDFNTTTDGKDNTIQRAEALYTVSDLTVGVTLQHVSAHADASAAKSIAAKLGNPAQVDMSSNSWVVYTSYQIGAWKPFLVYSKRQNPSFNGQDLDAGAKQWAAAVEYAVSKRTTVQASYGKVTHNEGARAIQGLVNNTESASQIVLKHLF